MIDKDDDVCPSCIRRRKKECGFEPYGWGPDRDGEYGVGCCGQLNSVTISNEHFCDILEDFRGVGDPLPWDLFYPIMIWSGFNWLNDPYAWRWYVESEKKNERIKV